MGGLISFGGLSSGLDTNAIVDALMNVERIPLKRLQANQQEIQQRVDLIGQLSNKLRDVQSSMSTLNSYFTYNNRKAESSNQDIISAQASHNAQDGNYNITVNNLATIGSRATQGISSIEEEIGTGSITIRANPSGEFEDFIIEIDETNNTLTGLRDTINQSGAPVRAMIINDGDPDNPMRLSITAMESGVSNDFEIINDLEGGTALNFNDIVSEAQNASINLNGINIERSSNTINDAVSGLTLNLRNTGSSTITVSNDTAPIREAITGLIESYNELNSFANENYQQGALANDSTLRNIMSSLRSSILLQVEGMEDAGYSFINLSQIGVDLERDGTLTLDTAMLDEALTNNPDSIQALFRTMGVSSSDQIGFLNSTAETQTGLYEIFITQEAQRADLSIEDPYISNSENEILTFTYMGGDAFDIELGSDQSLSDITETLNDYFSENNIGLNAVIDGDSLQIISQSYGSSAEFSVVSSLSSDEGTRIGNIEQSREGADVEGTINGNNAVGNGQILTGSEGNPEEGLQIRVFGTGNFSMNFTRGIASPTNNLIRNYSGTGGLLSSQTRSYQDYSRALDRQIEQTEDRLNQREIALRIKFAEVEQALGNMNSLMASFSAQTQQF